MRPLSSVIMPAPVAPGSPARHPPSSGLSCPAILPHNPHRWLRPWHTCNGVHAAAAVTLQDRTTALYGGGTLLQLSIPSRASVPKSAIDEPLKTCLGSRGMPDGASETAPSPAKGKHLS